MLEHCGETCGWTATVLSCLAFGSFGVPIKSDASERVNVDALVFQSYKSLMCFATCWAVLLLGEPLSFTPWGIVSGFFWVPGGVAGTYAVRKAGLALSQGLWSTFAVIAGMTWGVFVFRESVRSVPGACCAALLLILGLWGMSYCSSPGMQAKGGRGKSIPLSPSATPGKNRAENATVSVETDPLCADELTGVSFESSGDEEENAKCSVNGNAISARSNQTGKITLCGIRVSEYQLGATAAAFDGVWVGTTLAPLHYAGPNTKGLRYVISFGIGEMIITVVIWILRFIYEIRRTSSMRAAYDALPSFHVSEMWKSGCTAGALWSFGNICGIMSVTGIGLGVGQSVIQSSMLIGGLWGIFFYKEVTGVKQIIFWFLSAVVTLLGILWLSHEHQRF